MGSSTHEHKATASAAVSHGAGSSHASLDRVVSGILLAVGIAVIYRSWDLQDGTMGVGPGTFPMLLGLLLTVFSTYLVVFPARRTTGEDGFSTKMILPAAGLFLAVVVYVFLLSWAGFLLSSVVFGVVFLAGVCREPWVKSVVFSMLLSVVAYGIFDYALAVPLPRWGG